MVIVVVMIAIVVVVVLIVTVVVFDDFARLSGRKTGTREGGNRCPGASSYSRDRRRSRSSEGRPGRRTPIRFLMLHGR